MLVAPGWLARVPVPDAALPERVYADRVGQDGSADDDDSVGLSQNDQAHRRENVRTGLSEDPEPSGQVGRPSSS